MSDNEQHYSVKIEDYFDATIYVKGRVILYGELPQMIADANLGREVRLSLPGVGVADAWSLSAIGLYGPLMREAWDQLREDNKA